VNRALRGIKYALTNAAQSEFDASRIDLIATPLKVDGLIFHTARIATLPRGTQSQLFFRQSRHARRA
jgi:hypothetical protein